VTSQTPDQKKIRRIKKEKRRVKEEKGGN